MVKLFCFFSFVVFMVETTTLSCRAQELDKSYAVTAHISNTDVPTWYLYGMDISVIEGIHHVNLGPYLTKSNNDKYYIGAHAAWQIYPFRRQNRFRSFFPLDYHYFKGDDIMRYIGGVDRHYQSTRHIFNLGYGFDWYPIKADSFFVTSTIGIGYGFFREIPKISSYRGSVDKEFVSLLRLGVGYLFK